MDNIQFWRSKEFSDTSFLDLVKRTFGKIFTKGSDAKNWLITNGYYTSYPDIVTDGLILNLDAGNSDSFKGEPTTNLFPDIAGQSTKYSISQYSGKQDNISGYYYYPTSVHGAYTLSAYVRIFPDDTATGIRVGLLARYTDSTYTYVTDYNMTNDGNFKYYSITVTTDTQKTLNYIDGWIFDYSAPGNMRHCDAYNIQLEQKSYSTPFVNGTRGTTYATGGGWCDLSGNGNHGELVNGPTYNSDNLGSVVFDGANKIITPISSFGNNMTWCAWIKCHSNTSVFNMFMGKYLPYFSFYQGNCLFFSNNIGGLQSTILTESNLKLNTWYYATFTTEVSGPNTIMSIYTNGQHSTSTTFSGHQSGAGYVFTIGDGMNESNWYPFDGNVSAVKIYNKTLSASEVLQNFNAEKDRFGL